MLTGVHAVHFRFQGSPHHVSGNPHNEFLEGGDKGLRGTCNKVPGEKVSSKVWNESRGMTISDSRCFCDHFQATCCRLLSSSCYRFPKEGLDTCSKQQNSGRVP